MKRMVTILSVVALVAPVTMAVDPLVNSVQPVGEQRGGIKHVALAHMSDGIPAIDMPRSTYHESMGVAGPVSTTSDTMQTRGSAMIPQRGGGAFMTPRQRADVEIRSLSRKL